MSGKRHAIGNGKIIWEDEAVLPVVVKEVQSSFSVYEALRVINGRIVHLPDHIVRLEESAATIGLPLPSPDWEREIDKLLRVDGMREATVRIMVVGTADPLWFITWMPLLTYPSAFYEEGVSAILYEGERFLPQCKTGNLLLNYLSQKKARESNAFEALLVARDGEIKEGSRSNFYIIKDGVIKTAPDEEVLDGITRKSVIRAAEELGYRLEFVAPRIEEVWLADASFISSTSMGALSISSIDGRKINTDIKAVEEICRKVREWETED